jgi:PTS system fructose-specific IIC component
MSLIPLSKECIELEMNYNNKEDILNHLVDLVTNSGKISDIEKFRKAIFDREKKITTGIGSGIAIPHAKSDGVENFAIAFARSKEGLDFSSMDGNPAHLFFILGAPAEHDDEYLKGMSELSSFLKEPEFRNSLLEAESKDEIFKLLTSGD